MRKRNYKFMTVNELQDFVKAHDLMLVKDYPELKTKQRAVLVGKNGDTLEIIAKANGFDTEFVKYNLNDPKGFTSSCYKQIYFFGKVYLLHLLVAHTWVENDDPFLDKVAFKNKKRFDIRAENLYWTSMSDVVTKSAKTRNGKSYFGYWRNGTYYDTKGEPHKMSREEYLDMVEEKRGRAYRNKIETDRLKKQKQYAQKRCHFD